MHGEAPDALTSVALASRAPLVVCPAMDVEMWRNAATRDNVRVLRQRGATVVEPESGPLASGLDGPGTAGRDRDDRRRGRARGGEAREHERARCVVGAGRTEEPLDPVRVLTNRSSGRMGVALAEAARDRGAEVTLVAGPMSVDPPGGVRAASRLAPRPRWSAAMTRAAADADVVLMAAAVADYRPARLAREKIRRDQRSAHA